MKTNKREINELNNQILATKLLNQYFNCKKVLFFYSKKFNNLINGSLHKASKIITEQLIEVLIKKADIINQANNVNKALSKMDKKEANILISYLYFNKSCHEVAKENNISVRSFFRLINKAVTSFLKSYHLEKVLNRSYSEAIHEVIR